MPMDSATELLQCERNVFELMIIDSTSKDGVVQDLYGELL